MVFVYIILGLILAHMPTATLAMWIWYGIGVAAYIAYIGISFSIGFLKGVVEWMEKD